ncbi:cytochrome o ubiquinol oxidase subunit IV [Vibrio zhugei]|uniref:Cytochrome bo(3) ubiquinol oxidase subunit 4 n=1 Tax=Vibrio zhugei TaxID=2479546 RepID=A0ABV7C6I3_9VIBR|nr:cytochrome o ubiquinol oxidase subunit IV [Vibrio zhugei]
MSNQHAESSVKGYVVGFIMALVLTIVPFYFAATQSLPETTTYIIMFTCAIIQVIVHFIYFLHMEIKTEEGRWNFVSLMFSAIVVFIVIGGSIWIMWNLNINMAM